MKKTNHQYFMQIAIQEAKKGINAGHGGPYGGVIVKNNKIVAKSHNKVVLNHDVTAHGEMETIRAACKKLKTYDLKGCVLYTTAFPCPMCVAACK
ncbi:MAG: nucleoside deaminase [Mycoplasmoidaceae bacterium]|nr:nucleoside deaminase [Mycoplasmoidaceae bacterium]